MQKRAPSLPQIAVMVVFALSCSLILIYIWKSFGGASPLAPEGYRLTANFQEATQLADSADVRISGVTVGRVVKTVETSGRTRVTMQIDRRYAPIYRDARVRVRPQTPLNDMYLDVVSPGTPAAGRLRPNEVLDAGRTQTTVDVAEVLNAVSINVRDRFHQALDALSQALPDRGAPLHSALAALLPFARPSTRLGPAVSRPAPATPPSRRCACPRTAPPSRPRAGGRASARGRRSFG